MKPIFENQYSRSPSDFCPLTEIELAQIKANFKKAIFIESLIKNSEEYQDYNSSEDGYFDAKSLRIAGFVKDSKDLVIYVGFVQEDYMNAITLANLKDEFELDDPFYTEWRAIINVSEMKVIDVSRQEHNQYRRTKQEAQKHIVGDVI